MSSILRALKKLEGAPARDDILKPWRGELDVKNVVGRNARGRRLGRRLIWLLAAVGLLSICGWLLLTWEGFPGKLLLRKHSVDRVAVKPKAAPAAGKPAPKKTVSAAAPNARRPPAVQNKTRPGPVQNRSRSQTTPIKPAPAQTIARPKIAPASPPATARPRPQPALEAKGPDLPRPAPPSPSGAGESVPVIESGDSGFVVMAIAWSKNPERRLAVINGQVVHEKDSIEGAVVSEIGLDDVYLKKDGKLWRLKFKR